MVHLEQLTALIDFLESHPQLALGQRSRSIEGRMEGNRLWTECANLINSISPDFATKSVNEWRKFYNEYKYKLTKKIKQQKREMSATGGSPEKKITLSPLEERLFTILGRDLGDQVQGPSTMQEQGPRTAWEQSPSTAREQCPSTAPEQGPSTAWEQRPSTTRGQRPSRVPPARASRTQEVRRRRPRQQPNTEEINHAALEASQKRLERIENRNAAAILSQAQATRNLSEAIDRLSQQTLEAANNMAAATTQAATILAAAIERVADCFHQIKNETTDESQSCN